MRAFWAALLFIPLWSHAADKDAAQRLLDEGGRLFDAGDYAGALERFEEAHRHFPSPRLLFNIGETNRRLGRTDEARQAYARFLKEAGPDIPEDLRQEADRALRAMEAAPPPTPPAAQEPPPPWQPARELTPAAVAVAPAPQEPAPFYRRWPFWVSVGAVVAGGVVAGVLLANRGEDLPDYDLLIRDRP